MSLIDGMRNKVGVSKSNFDDYLDDIDDEEEVRSMAMESILFGEKTDEDYTIEEGLDRLSTPDNEIDELDDDDLYGGMESELGMESGTGYDEFDDELAYALEAAAEMNEELDEDDSLDDILDSDGLLEDEDEEDLYEDDDNFM